MGRAVVAMGNLIHNERAHQTWTPTGAAGTVTLGEVTASERTLVFVHLFACELVG